MKRPRWSDGYSRFRPSSSRACRRRPPALRQPRSSPDLRLGTNMPLRSCLSSGAAQTMPPFIPFIIGEGGQDWRRSPPQRRCSSSRILCSRSCCGAICFAASPLEQCANDKEAASRASRWPLWLRRGPCEAIAMALIGLGVVMLMPARFPCCSTVFLCHDPGRNAGICDRQHFPD